MTNKSTLNRVERACADLLRNGQAVTFTAVAAQTGLGRTTLYRDSMLCSGTSSRRTVTAPPPAAPSPASPTRSPPSAPHSTPSPQACATTKNNSGN